jgi:DnaJ family protein C protein 7
MKLAEKRGDDVQMKEMKKKLREAQVALKRSKQKDFYKMLGIGRDANESEIKKSYRKSALKWHPDRHANSSEEEKTEAEKTFRDINLAYEVLSDPQKKQKYDSGVDVEDLDNPHAGHGHGHGHGHGGIDQNVLFEMFMRQQGGGGGGGFHFG